MNDVNLNSLKIFLTVATSNSFLEASNKLYISQPVGGLSKILNKYLYSKYLDDAGKYYLNFCKFKKIINNNFKNRCNISYLSFKNILGNYMIAVIEKR